MATKPRFDLMNIPRYLWNGPARIRQTLAEQGPTAASRAARFYSLALCLVTFVIYFLMSCVLGFLQVQVYAGSAPNMDAPGVLVFLVLAGVVLLAAALVAIWAAVLGVLGLLNPQEDRGKSFGALLWGIALVIFYGGFASGLIAPGR